ncbi:hypothetical protein M9H77_16223 [Catharanthus roseus]|uniref:Uncharacterized protein n=1 Tax=Catharanthus roseus TaxID=4058 RepID=A0ACC0AZQ0_CATRO|nr:hypothetical protein M9H77_16223 [Catharanthus roseus]
MLYHWNTLRIKPSPNRIGGTRLKTRKQKDLTKRFSRSKYFEELHKHQKGKKKGGKFHEVRRKTEEDTEASGTAMPDDLQLMAIVAGRTSCGHLYRARSEVAHLIAKSNHCSCIGIVLLESQAEAYAEGENVVSEYLLPSTST